MRNDGFTIGMLVAFQMFASRLSQPMLRLVGLWQEFQQAAIAVKRLGDIMNAPAEPSYAARRRARVAERGGSRVQELAFRYAESLPYLYEKLNLRLRAGRVRRAHGRLRQRQEHARQAPAGLLSCRPTAASS